MISVEKYYPEVKIINKKRGITKKTYEKIWGTWMGICCPVDASFCILLVARNFRSYRI